MTAVLSVRPMMAVLAQHNVMYQLSLCKVSQIGQFILWPPVEVEVEDTCFHFCLFFLAIASLFG